MFMFTLSAFASNYKMLTQYKPRAQHRDQLLDVHTLLMATCVYTTAQNHTIDYSQRCNYRPFQYEKLPNAYNYRDVYTSY